MTAGSHGEVQQDDGRFRVTQWTVEPGGTIPMHRHEHDYVVVPLVDDTMYAVGPDGTEIAAHLRIGESYTRNAGVEHRIENRGTETIVFVEVERL
ncbi:cupin domain-containing protein [Gordonia paraffinivorans]|uniref:cupin domain-containing protein n=1 Tax=Gordonia paraffinivorans TaxID=175628 RepID=UPI0014465B12|nr:cupin domain-containing protein [Gordonia paraffinivorans]